DIGALSGSTGICGYTCSATLAPSVISCCSVNAFLQLTGWKRAHTGAQTPINKQPSRICFTLAVEARICHSPRPLYRAPPPVREWRPKTAHPIRVLNRHRGCHLIQVASNHASILAYSPLTCRVAPLGVTASNWYSQSLDRLVSEDRQGRPTLRR